MGKVKYIPAILICLGAALGLLGAFVSGVAAWDHNPQNEFHGDIPHFLLLCSTWFLFIFVPFLIAAILIRFIIGNMKKTKQIL